MDIRTLDLVSNTSNLLSVVFSFDLELCTVTTATHVAFQQSRTQYCGLQDAKSHAGTCLLDTIEEHE